MNSQFVHYSLRVEKELFEKFKYIAKHEYRSTNSELVQCIKACIREYESQHGEIFLPNTTVN